MTIQYERIYELIIGDYKNGKGVKITDLNVRFEVSKNSNNKETSDGCMIEVFNLSKETRAILETNYPAAVLSCGYKSTGLKRLFSGEVTFSTSRKQGSDVVTQIQIGSGYVELTHNYIESAVPPGGTVKEAIEQIRQKMPGVAKGVYTGTFINSKMIDGYPIYGNPKRTLDELSRTYQIEWRVDNGVLYVTDPKGSIDSKGNAFLLTKNTGLINIPYETAGDIGKSGKDKNRKKGLQLQALLNTEIRPQGLIKIESELFNGVYRVDSCRYYGEYRGNDWYVDIFCSYGTEEEVVENAAI
jgi:hypothetical protein